MTYLVFSFRLIPLINGPRLNRLWVISYKSNASQGARVQVERKNMLRLNVNEAIQSQDLGTLLESGQEGVFQATSSNGETYQIVAHQGQTIISRVQTQQGQGQQGQYQNPQQYQGQQGQQGQQTPQGQRSWTIRKVAELNIQQQQNQPQFQPQSQQFAQQGQGR